MSDLNDDENLLNRSIVEDNDERSRIFLSGDILLVLLANLAGKVASLFTS